MEANEMIPTVLIIQSVLNFVFIWMATRLDIRIKKIQQSITKLRNK
jgi:hypothetical protein